MSIARAISEHHGGSRNFTSDAAQFMSDEALVAGAKMGDGSFFGELHERHRERMFQVAHRITRHREDAQDAVQESFLRKFAALFQSGSSTRSGSFAGNRVFGCGSRQPDSGARHS
jgi:hypothetical protein